VGSSLFPWANVGGHLAVATAFSLPPRVSTALPASPLLSLWPCLYVTPALSSSTAGEGWEGAFGPRSPKPEHVSAIGAGRGLGQVEADLFTFVFSLLYILIITRGITLQFPKKISFSFGSLFLSNYLFS
jgi:hypothetical protein